MPISEHASGSQTAVISTEHTLNGTSPETTDGVFVLTIDTANMAAGDTVAFTIKEKCRSGDTQRILFVAILANAQAEPLWQSPAPILLHGWDMTLNQTTGTGRAYPWSIRKIA